MNITTITLSDASIVAAFDTSIGTKTVNAIFIEKVVGICEDYYTFILFDTDKYVLEYDDKQEILPSKVSLEERIKALINLDYKRQVC